MRDDRSTAGPASALVLGIGNVLLSDEGAGVHALIYLSERHPVLPGVRYLDGGTLSFTLAEAVEDAERLRESTGGGCQRPAAGVRGKEGSRASSLSD